MSSFYIKKADEIAIRNKKFCFYCQTSFEKIEIEHIVPQSKGGTCELTNITSACKRCNLYKSDFTIDVFLDRIIEKRHKVYLLLMKLITRASVSAKRHGKDQQEFLTLIAKIKVQKKEFTYFTSIINSIHTKKYIICHG